MRSAFDSTRRIRVLVAASVLLMVSIAHATTTTIQPPPTRTDDIQPADPYRWLETETPERRAWIRGQNRASSAFLRDRKSRAWFEAFFKRENDKPSSVERFRIGDTAILLASQGLGKPVQVIKRNPDGSQNLLFQSHEDKRNGSIAITRLALSPDQNTLIVVTAASGSSDEYVFHLIDVASGQRLEKIERTLTGRPVWIAENEFVYGERLGRAVISFRHKIGSDPHRDLVDSKNPEINVSNEKFGEDPWIFIRDGKTTRFKSMKSETWFSIDTNIETIIGLEGQNLFHLTKTNEGLGQVERVHLGNPSSPLRSEIVISEGPMFIRSASLQGQKLVLVYQMGATQKVAVTSLEGTIERSLLTSPTVSIKGVWYSENKDRLSIQLTSQIRGKSYEYDFATRGYIGGDPESDLLVRNGIRYVSQVIQVSSSKGTQVPVRITHKAGLSFDGRNPALIEGYGGFGLTDQFDPTPDLTITEFLNRGGVFIAPALRGGDELGGPWHTDGMRSKKQNVFDDLIATAEYVIQRGYTSSSRLAVIGASNGGLLVSAVATQRPDLFRLAIPIAGVHDMLRKERLDTVFDEGWSSEYGNTDIVEDFKTLISYSPLHNLKRQAYPTFLIVVGENDSRVNPAHSYKIAGALQSVQTGANPILLTSTKNTGHFARSIGRQGLIGWRHSTSIWSTIFDELKIETDPQGSFGF